jgi:hypothetical protein
MFLRSLAGGKGSKIFTFLGFWIGLAGVKSVFAGF